MLLKILDPHRCNLSRLDIEMSDRFAAQHYPCTFYSHCPVLDRCAALGSFHEKVLSTIYSYLLSLLPLLRHRLQISLKAYMTDHKDQEWASAINSGKSPEERNSQGLLPLHC